MKKFAAFILALVLIIPFGFCATADDDGDHYIWLKSESADSDISLEFEIPRSICSAYISDAKCSIAAEAEFVDCEGDSAYLFCRVYDVDENIAAYYEFAAQNDSDETAAENHEWQQFECEFNPCDGNYGEYDGKHIAASQIGTITFGMGFHNATGIIKAEYFRLAVCYNGFPENVWLKRFDYDFNIDADEVRSKNGVTADDEGTLWGIGNYILDRMHVTVYTPQISSYVTDLNDGVISETNDLNNIRNLYNWFGFCRNKNIESGVEYEGMTLHHATVVYAYNKEKSFDTVRVHVWDAGSMGVSRPEAIVVSVSDDGETWSESFEGIPNDNKIYSAVGMIDDWREIGSLSIGDPCSIYWADLALDEAVSARLVKIDIYYKS